MKTYSANSHCVGDTIAEIEARVRLGSVALPDASEIFVGDGDFLAIGLEFLRYFIQYGQLQRSSKVVDVGCGIGRMAIPLMHYLDADGRYVGLDVNRTGIAWCQRNIERIDPRFHFYHVDAYHPLYNIDGKLLATEVVLPEATRGIDLAVATSLFTHLFLVDALHYLIQLRRALKPSGRVLVTAFLIRDEDRIAMGDAHLSSSSEAGEMFTDPVNPLAATFYPIDRFNFIVRQAGLTIEGPVRFGHWRGNGGTGNFQDVVVLRQPLEERGRG